MTILLPLFLLLLSLLLSVAHGQTRRLRRSERDLAASTFSSSTTRALTDNAFATTRAKQARGKAAVSAAAAFGRGSKGSPGKWTLVEDISGGGDLFGSTVAFDGEMLLVGGRSATSVYGGGDFSSNLTTLDKPSSIVAACDGYLGVGATFVPGDNRGIVEIYNSQSNTRLARPLHGLSPGSLLGRSLQIASRDDSLLIAMGARDSVSILQYNTTTTSNNSTTMWQPCARWNDAWGFGMATAMSKDGSLLVVGSPFYNRNKQVDTRYGRIQVYQRQQQQDEWLLVAETVGKRKNGLFGYSVDMVETSTGNVYFAVGSVYNNKKRKGMVTLYKLVNNRLQRVAKPIKGKRAHEFFGQAVSLQVNEDDLVFLAVSSFGPPGNRKGLVKVYYLDEKSKVLSVGSQISGASRYEAFGMALDLSTSESELGVPLLAVGAPFENEARIYEYASPSSKKMRS